MVCATAERRARGAEEARFRSTSDLRGDGAAGGHSKPREEVKMKNPMSVPLRGAMGNPLQHVLGAELFTHHLGEELLGLHSSITTPKAENLPEASSPLLCLSIALLQQHHSTL